MSQKYEQFRIADDKNPCQQRLWSSEMPVPRGFHRVADDEQRDPLAPAGLTEKQRNIYNAIPQLVRQINAERTINKTRSTTDDWTESNLPTDHAISELAACGFDVEAGQLRAADRAGNDAVVRWVDAIFSDPADDAQGQSFGGVSLLAAALCVTDGDDSAAKESVRRWQHSRATKLPKHMGVSAQHKQRKLYEPSSLSEFILKVEQFQKVTKAELSKRLRARSEPCR